MSAVFAERFAQAQAALSSAEARVSGFAGSVQRTLEPGPIPTPQPLQQVLPGLRPGSSVSCGSSTSLLLALAAAAIQEDSWCAIIGMPNLGLGAAWELGLDPTRTALLPDPGTHLRELLSAMIDGLDVVVIGCPITEQVWRAAISRARAQDTLLLAADPPGRADVRFSVAHVRWRGLSSGSGRLRHHDVEVSVQAKGRTLGAAAVSLPSVTGQLVSAPAMASPGVSGRANQNGQQSGQRPRLSLIRAAS